MLKELKNEDIIYWSNSEGELHHNGEYDIDDENMLPEKLRKVYNELWRDIYGLPCYLMEYEGKFGVSFNVEYDGAYAETQGISYERLCDIVQRKAEIIASVFKNIEECKVAFGRDINKFSNGEIGSELMVFLDGTTNKATAVVVGAYLYAVAYSDDITSAETYKDFLDCVSQNAAELNLEENDISLTLEQIGITLFKKHEAK